MFSVYKILSLSVLCAVFIRYCKSMYIILGCPDSFLVKTSRKYQMEPKTAVGVMATQWLQMQANGQCHSSQLFMFMDKYKKWFGSIASMLVYNFQYNLYIICPCWTYLALTLLFLSNFKLPFKSLFFCLLLEKNIYTPLKSFLYEQSNSGSVPVWV